LIREDFANGLQVFFGIVLRREILFLNRIADHDQSTA
jgi:hypothetical protein